jgi:Protein of unknown function (DUF2800)
MSYHALFSPSSASRWIRCPASLMYNLPGVKDHYPERGCSEAADIGNYIHKVAAHQYHGTTESVNEGTLNLSDSKVKAKIDKIPAYIDFLYAIGKIDKTETTFLSDIKVEQLVLDPLFPGYFGGTPDFFRVDLAMDNKHRIWIVDLKTGRSLDDIHREQLTAYAELLIRHYTSELRRRGLVILEAPTFTVYQHVYYLERVRDPVDSWIHTFTSPNLSSCQFKYTTAVQEYSDVLDRGAYNELPFETGTHCKWCPGRIAGCPVFAAHMHAIGEECEKPDPTLCAERTEFLEEVARMAWGRLRAASKAKEAAEGFEPVL